MELLLNNLEPIIEMRWIYTWEGFFIIFFCSVVFLIILWKYHFFNSKKTQIINRGDSKDKASLDFELWRGRWTYIKNHNYELSQSTSMKILYTLLLQFLEIKYRLNGLDKHSLSDILSYRFTLHEKHLINTLYLALYKDEPLSDVQKNQLIDHVGNVAQKDNMFTSHSSIEG